MMFEGVKTENFNLVLVNGLLIDEWIDKLEPLLLKSTTRFQNARTVRDMLSDIKGERAGVQLWMVFTPAEIVGVYVCTAQQTLSGIVYTFELLASEQGTDWIDETIEPFMDQVAKAYGIAEFHVIGPLGWWRKLRQYGFEEPQFVTRKVVKSDDRADAA